jgi:threonine synthase
MPGSPSPPGGSGSGADDSGGDADPDPDGASTPPGLVCPGCGERYPPGPDEPWRCDCGHPLELDADPVPDGAPAVDRDRGLWAAEGFLPVVREVTLGEGWTPLVDAPGWDAAFKLEYVFPSGSFKDRGAATMLSRAAALGVERVVEDSSGNAGAAVAQYAARAGIDADVYVPADAKPAKITAIERTGANPVRVEGSRADVTDACIDAVEDGDAWYASHAWNPAFFAGTSTFALEVAAQRGWEAPDAVVFPVGHGTLLLGAHRGFRRLERAGWIDEVPRLLAAQAAGVTPLVDALDGASVPADGSGGGNATNDVADGIQIAAPARLAEQVAAVEATGGAAVPVGAERTRDVLGSLRRAGFHVEPTCAVAPAALARLRELGVVDDDADVVVPLTGSGLKDPA